jgi:hypothetical protein
MSVWLTIPSARPATEIAERLGKWRRKGYNIALWRNGPHVNDPILGIARPTYNGKPVNMDNSARYFHPDRYDGNEVALWYGNYLGWGSSINRLITEVIKIDADAQWFVGGGDDTDPDPTKTADEIAAECTEHFGGTFGIMQPTGHRWGEEEAWAQATYPNEPAYIDRICGSPWIGREAARRLNGGKGPLWAECYHMFSDQILKEHAEKIGILWQRRDLTHFHDHPRRDGVARTPDFAAESGIYTNHEWDKSKGIYERLKANYFKECDPIA